MSPQGNSSCAGRIDELVFWLNLWHNALDPSMGMGIGHYFADLVKTEARRWGILWSRSGLGALGKDDARSAGAKIMSESATEPAGVPASRVIYVPDCL